MRSSTMKPKKKLRQRVRKQSIRPALIPITPEMQHWSALLEEELKTWPDVTAKRLFSFRSFYRGKTIFAALPRSRSFNSATSIIFKFNPMPTAFMKRAQADARVNFNTRISGTGWLSFELKSEADLRDALWWLNRAYECAKGRTR
jgi:hypothetical protein